MAIVNLFPVPDGLVALCGGDDDLFPDEVPLHYGVLHDTGEITYAAWSEKQRRVHFDVSDKLFFPDFQRLAFVEEEEEPDDEPAEEGGNDELE